MSVVYFRLASSSRIKLKGECDMSLPKTISGWCLWLFFLWYGVGSFVTLPLFATIAGVLALGYAIFTLIGR